MSTHKSPHLPTRAHPHPQEPTPTHNMPAMCHLLYVLKRGEDEEMELLEVAEGTEAERSTRGALAVRSSPASNSVMELTSLVLGENPLSPSIAV